MAFPQKKSDTLSWIGSGIYVVLLWLTACSLGIGLTAYDVAPLIWLGTLGVTLHLAWAGSAAIAPAMVWLLALMWIATITYAMPQPIYLLKSMLGINFMPGHFAEYLKPLLQ